MKAWLTRIRRFVRSRRRLLAAVLAGLAAWSALTALRPPEPQTTPVLVTTRAITGGDLFTAAEVQLRPLPVTALPAEYLTDLGQVIGRPATVPLPAGAVLVPSAVVSRTALAAPGLAVLPVPLAVTAAGLVEVGDRIDLLGNEDGTAPVASAARVVAVLDPGEDDSGLAPVGSGGIIVLVELRPDAVAKVAAAAARGPLGFGFR